MAGASRKGVLDQGELGALVSLIERHPMAKQNIMLEIDDGAIRMRYTDEPTGQYTTDAGTYNVFDSMTDAKVEAKAICKAERDKWAQAIADLKTVGHRDLPYYG